MKRDQTFKVTADIYVDNRSWSVIALNTGNQMLPGEAIQDCLYNKDERDSFILDREDFLPNGTYQVGITLAYDEGDSSVGLPAGWYITSVEKVEIDSQAKSSAADQYERIHKGILTLDTEPTWYEALTDTSAPVTDGVVDEMKLVFMSDGGIQVRATITDNEGTRRVVKKL